MKQRRFAFLFLVFGMAGCSYVPKEFLEAQRKFHRAIAPEYRAYVENDVRLDVDQKARRLTTIKIWNLSITAEEQR